MHALPQVPSFGVLTNSRDYRLYKWDRSAGRLVAINMLQMSLSDDMSVDEAAKIAGPVISSLVGMIESQCQALDAMLVKRQRTG